MSARTFTAGQPSDESRRAAAIATLKLQGYVQNGEQWDGQHYIAEITDRPTMDAPGATPSFVIAYRARS